MNERNKRQCFLFHLVRDFYEKQFMIFVGNHKLSLIEKALLEIAF